MFRKSTIELPKIFMKSGEKNEAVKDAKSPDQESKENGLIESVMSPASGNSYQEPFKHRNNYMEQNIETQERGCQTTVTGSMLAKQITNARKSEM